MKFTKKNFFLAGAVLFLIVAQFFRIDKTNPPVDQAKDFLTVIKPPTEIASMIKNSCYDCHSNETKYPWYSDVAPVSWMVKRHIVNGRNELNFSEWASYSEKKAAHKMEESVEMLENGSMPMKSYTVMHGEAKISKEQRKQLADWFRGE